MRRGDTRAARDDRITVLIRARKAVACPECGAQLDELCKGPRGAVLSWLHNGRLEAFDKMSTRRSTGAMLEKVKP